MRRRDAYCMGTHVSNVEKATGITHGGQGMRVRDSIEAASARLLGLPSTTDALLARCLG